jgi:hypothetical protein
MESESVIDDREPGQTIVDKISDGGFVDGIEIRQIIEILRVQNEGDVNNELSKTDATTAAMMVRNGLFTRLVLLVSRVYPHRILCPIRTYHGKAAGVILRPAALFLTSRVAS